MRGMRSGWEEVVPAPGANPERGEVEQHADGEEPPVGDGQAGHDLAQVDVPEDVDQEGRTDGDADENLYQPPPRWHCESGSAPAGGDDDREQADHAWLSTRIMVVRAATTGSLSMPASAARMSRS